MKHKTDVAYLTHMSSGNMIQDYKKEKKARMMTTTDKMQKMKVQNQKQNLVIAIEFVIGELKKI